MAIFGYSQVAAAIKGAAKNTPIGGAIGAVANSLAPNAFGAGESGAKKRRARRRNLTLGQKADIDFLKNTVSLKAAESYISTHKLT